MKVVVVTGAAGQLGSAICQEFAKLKYKVVATDLNQGIRLDVTDIKSIKKALKLIIQKYDKIDAFINNAGIAVFTPFEQRTFDEFDKVMKVNAYGTFFCCQEVLKYMEKQLEGGNIINIASIYGVVSPDPKIYGNSGRNSSEVYGMSKAAIIQLTKYLAHHIHNKRIRINSVSPGGIFNNQKQDFVNKYNEKVPLGRMATAKEIAKVVTFLCSNSASYINGQNILVDGGLSCR